MIRQPEGSAADELSSVPGTELFFSPATPEFTVEVMMSQVHVSTLSSLLFSLRDSFTLAADCRTLFFPFLREVMYAEKRQKSKRVVL